MLRSGVAELGAMRGLINANGALDAFGPEADGPAVMLVPGSLAGDPSLGPLPRHLAAAGFRPYPAGITATSTVRAAVGRLAARLHTLAEPASLVGHSRGGMLRTCRRRIRPW